jgi:tetratricopeptide (TPR) repeat protein
VHTDLANMGCLYLRHGEYAAALSHFQEALDIARQLGDKISIAKWLHNLGFTYARMGNPILAKNYQLEEERMNQQVAAARAVTV